MCSRFRGMHAGFYMPNGIHKIQFACGKTVDIQRFAEHIFSRNAQLAAVRGVYHIGSFIETGFRIITYLVRTAVYAVRADRTPRIAPRKGVSEKAQYFFCAFIIADPAGKGVFGHLFPAGIKIEAADQRIRNMFSRNDKIGGRIVFPTEYERHKADFFGNAAGNFKLCFFRTLRAEGRSICCAAFCYNIDNAAHCAASVQNGIGTLYNLDTLDVFYGNLKNRRRARHIGRNAYAVYHDFYIPVPKSLHRNRFIGIARRSGAHRNIRQGF